MGTLALLSVCWAGWCRLAVYVFSLAAVREEEICCQKNKKEKKENKELFKHLIVSGKTLPPVLSGTKETKKWHMASNSLSVHLREMLVWPP